MAERLRRINPDVGFAAFETNWKEPGAQSSTTKEVTRFRTEAVSFVVLYRGYDIEVSRAPSGWRVGVYPRTADLPILRCGEAYACDQDAAVIEAKRRVDGALH